MRYGLRSPWWSLPRYKSLISNFSVEDDWCCIYLGQRSEIVLLIKHLEDMGFRKCLNARVSCTCRQSIYATPHCHLGNSVFWTQIGECAVEG
jgi:hypothetical protein